MRTNRMPGVALIVNCLAIVVIAGVVGCAGSTTTASGLRLKKSAPVTSCSTGRASGAGEVDTVDVEWLMAPLRVLSYADPVYPESALNANQGGEIEARVLINPDGTIGKVVDVTGPEVFRTPAMEAIHGAELTPPTSVYGQPVVVCGTLVVSFQPAHGGLSWLNLRTRQ